jgi:ketosteroid isomerase-like protein
VTGLTALNQTELQQFASTFEQAFNQNDYKAMASFYAHNAVLIGDNTKTKDTQPAIEEFWKTACGHFATLGVKRTIQIHHIDVSGDLGYVLGTVTLAIPNPNAQATTTLVRYVTVWRRQPDALWRLVVDISNRDPN